MLVLGIQIYWNCQVSKFLYSRHVKLELRILQCFQQTASGRLSFVVYRSSDTTVLFLKKHQFGVVSSNFLKQFTNIHFYRIYITVYIYHNITVYTTESFINKIFFKLGRYILTHLVFLKLIVYILFSLLFISYTSTVSRKISNFGVNGG